MKSKLPKEAVAVDLQVIETVFHYLDPIFLYTKSFDSFLSGADNLEARGHHRRLYIYNHLDISFKDINLYDTFLAVAVSLMVIIANL